MRRWGWLFPVVLMVGLLAGTAVAQSDTIQACVNPSGSIFVVDDASECGGNETSLSWSSGGGSSAAVTYYTVEASFASPPIPPEPSSGDAALNWIPEGTELNCEPGDVAVDFNHWSTGAHYTWQPPDPMGSPTEWYGGSSEDAVIPNIANPGEAPNGFIVKKEIPVGASHHVGMEGITHWASTSERHFAVTCADVTP